MKLRWVDTVSEQYRKTLDTHDWELFMQHGMRDMRCTKCGYVVWEVDCTVENGSIIIIYGGVPNEYYNLTCNEWIMAEVLL